MKTTRNARGFTWIEALVVLAILLILAAILFPVFVRPSHHGGSRRSTCQSNMKQIALGFKQYIQDYNDKFPNPGWLSATRDNRWAREIENYTKSDQNFGCPSDAGWRERKIDATKSNSYYFNRNLAGKTLKQVRWPKNTILLGEGEASASDYNCASFGLCFSGGVTMPVPQTARLRHLDGANYAFVDGHVKWLRPHHIQSRRISAGTYGFPIR